MFLQAKFEILPMTCLYTHCVKSVQIRKIRTRKNTFHAAMGTFGCNCNIKCLVFNLSL